MHIGPVFDKVVCQLYVIEKGTRIYYDSPDNATYHLWSVCILVLHAKRMAQDLKNLEHGAV
jgi:hypothetical protein